MAGRSGKKPTVKQMQEAMLEMTDAIEQQNQMLRVVFSEVDKLNMVVVRLLEAQGLLHKETCECGFVVNTPLFEDIPIPTHCPACDKALAGDEEE